MAWRRDLVERGESHDSPACQQGEAEQHQGDLSAEAPSQHTAHYGAKKLTNVAQTGNPGSLK